MAGFNSLAATAIGALNVANTVMKAYDSYQDDSGLREYEQEKALKNLEMQQDSAKAEFEKGQIRENARMAEDERRRSLRKIMAERRAKYGSGGTGAADGSGQAVLLGLFDESEEERRVNESDNAFKISEIDRNLENRQRINTLQLSQLKERNKIKKAGSLIDNLTSVF